MKALAALPGLAAWAAAIVLPLALLYGSADWSQAGSAWSGGEFSAALLRSIALAGGVAAAAVALGWLPGRLLGSPGRGRPILLAAILLALLLPPYVLYYAWWLPASPTTPLGRWLAADPARAEWANVARAVASLVLWYWPLAALLLAAGWRRMDRELWEAGRLEAAGPRRMLRVTGPMIARHVLLAFAVCFVLALSDFGPFHLAGMNTLSTALATVYDQTGSAAAVAWAASPVAVAALAVAIPLSRQVGSMALAPALDSPPLSHRRSAWAVTAGLLALALPVPVALLLWALPSMPAASEFARLHGDELAGSGRIALLAAALSLLIASAPTALEASGAIGRRAAALVRVTVLWAMLLPGSLLGVALIELMARADLPGAVRSSWAVVSIGQAARFAGVAMIVLAAARDGQERLLGQMASADGAGAFARLWHIHLPRAAGLLAAAASLCVLLSFTELPATMVLLGPGVSNFAQRLLNQMHYARDREVIASCLALAAVAAAGAGLAVAALALLRRRSAGRRVSG